MKSKSIKRIIVTGALISASFIFTACAGSESSVSRSEDKKSSVEEVLSNATQESETNTQEVQKEEAQNSNNEKPSKTDGIDVDLTEMSSTLIYSEVYNMMNEPESYIGKTVKMQGAFAVYEEAFNGENIYACIVKDATACCATGIEFVREGVYDYPEDYPEKGNEITVTGVFDVYQDGDYKYCTLRNAQMV